MDKYVIQPLKRLLHDRSFVICFLFLAISAGGLRATTNWLGMHLIKLPLKLQKSLDELDVDKLAPYRLSEGAKSKIRIEDQDVLAELGTEDYIQWMLVNSQLAETAPARHVMLFVTYYTGDPGQVPHVPEVCYTGGGGVVNTKSKENIHVINSEGKQETIPLRILDISSSDGRKVKVAYFFSVNGGYESDRNLLRMRLRNPVNKYAYFSKVEMVFHKGGELTVAETVKAAEDLSRRVVPVLVKEHWPKWPPEENNESKDNVSVKD